MNIEENKIVEFLSVRPNLFVSASEVSKLLDRKKYDLDRNWARPILRRMELGEMLESNHFGEYRLKKKEETTSFRKALTQPGHALGDTAIIILGETTNSNSTQFSSYTAQTLGSQPGR